MPGVPWAASVDCVIRRTRWPIFRTLAGTDGFASITSHVFRSTTATILDEAGFIARVIADQLGHSKLSMTQDVYLGRKAVSRTPQ